MQPNPLFASALLATVLPWLPFSARAQEVETWNPGGAGGGNGTWDAGVTADWNSDTVWTNSNDALFSGTGGTITVVNPSADALTFAATGPYLLSSGTLTLTGTGLDDGGNISTTVTVNSAATFAGTVDSTGDLLETGAATLTVTGTANIGMELYVGYSETGTLTISNGGKVSTAYATASEYAIIGELAGSSGSVTVTGSGSTLTDYSDLYVGDSGSGTLTISNGGSVTNGQYFKGASIGQTVGSAGTVTVTGSGSTWTDNGDFYVGNAGTGTLTISNGGSVTNGQYFTGAAIGEAAGSSGTVTVTGSGSTWTDRGDLYVGFPGTGTLTISNGGSVSNSSASGTTGAIIANDGATGTVTVTGSGSTWTDGGNLYVGDSGTGTLTISNGGTVVCDSNGYLGFDAGSSGAVTVTGSGSTWRNTGGLAIGGNSGAPGGAGILNITGGGSVSAAETTVWNPGTLALGENANLSGPLTISGGTLTLVDGQLHTVTLTNPVTIEAGSNLGFEVGDGADQLAFSGSGSLALTGTGAVNVYGLSGLVTSGTDLLIGAATSGNLSLGNVYNSGNFTYALLSTATCEEVVVTAAATPLTTAYWTGAQDNVWSILVGGSASNWATNLAGTADPRLTPSATTDVIFSANGAASEGDTVLGTNMTIHSLTISDTNAVEISGADVNPWMGTDTLTISGSSGTTGITINSGAGPVTFGVNVDLSGTSQKVIVENAAGLLVSGSMGGSYGLYVGGNSSGPGSAGLLSIAAGGSVSAARTTVWDTGTLAFGQNAILNSPLIVNGGTLTLADGQLQIVTLNNPMTIDAGSTLDFEVGNGPDEIAFSGSGSLTVTGAAKVNLYGLSGLVSSGTGVLIGASTSGHLSLGDVYNSGNFIYSLLSTATSEDVVLTAAATPLTTAYWKGGQDNIWSILVGGTATNWTTDQAGTSDPHLTPSATTNVIFSAASPANEGDTVLGTDMTIQSLTVSDTNAVTISGANPLGTNTLTVSGTNTPDAITINSGAGLVTIGANLDLTGSSQVITVNNASGLVISGSFGGSNGLVTLGAGGLTLNNGGNFGYETVDAEGGSLVIQNGAVMDGVGYVGLNPGSSANVTVTGSGSQWQSFNEDVIGGFGSGTLKVTGGGLVDANFEAYIGFYPGSSGAVTVTGSGSSLTTTYGDFYVGNYGTGTLTISNGGSVTNGRGFFIGATIGEVAGSSGSVMVTGSGSTWTDNGDLYVGDSGTGTLTITNGGSVTNGAYIIGAAIGYNAGSSGTVTVTGSGSTWTDNGGLSVGGAGTGRLIIFNGGSVGASTVSIGEFGTLALGKKAILAGTLTLNEGTVTLVDGQLHTVTLSGSLEDIGGATYDFEVGNGSDQLAVPGGFSISGTSVVNLYGLSGQVTSGTDVLLTASPSVGGGSLALGNVYNTGNFTYALEDTGSSEDVIVTATTALTTAYWKGGQSNVWSVLIGGSATNWTTDAGGTHDPLLTPGATTDVVFSGSGAANQGDTVLGTSMTIHSLTVSDTNAVVISGSDPEPWMGTDTLTISGSSGTTGIAVDSGAALVEIGANVYLSGSSQTVTVNNGAGLSISGNLRSSNGLIKSGTGTLTLAGVGGFGSGTVDVEFGGLAVENALSNGTGYIGLNAGSAGTVAVSGSGSTWTNTEHLLIGYSGNGTLAITNGGAVSDAAGYLGVNAGSNGAATVSGAGSAWTNTNNLVVGYSGTGSLTIAGGGAAFAGDGYIAYGAGSTGTATVSGSGSKWASKNGLLIAYSGTGTLAISGGGAVSDFASYIGVSAGANGAATLSGTGSTWTNTSNFVAGFVGAGTVTSSSGAALSDSNGYIGYEAAGAVTLSGSGTDWTNISNLHVGDFARGTLTVSGGAVVSDFSGYLGASAGSDGLATISGTGSTWTNKNNFAVGYSGTGVLIVSGGGAVSDAGGYVGYGAGSIGTVTVSGSGAKWSTSGALAIGDSGTGTLIVEEGAWVSVTGATTIGSAGTLEFDGGSTFNTGSLGIDGGALVTLGAATFAPSATLGAGGVRINTGGFNSIFSGNFSGTGGITKVGSGVATLTGASTYTGATSINAGTLALTTASAHTASFGNTAITVASGATFSATLGASPFSKVVNAGTTGSGSAGATLTLNPGSTFSMAGNTLATFNLQQENSFSGPAFTIGGASGIAPSLIFDIGNAGAGTDLLHVTKTVRVLATGGDVTIDALAGDTSLTSGSYNLIASAGGFSGVNGNGLALSGTTLAISGTTYDLSLAHSTADDEILTVSAGIPSERSAPESSFAAFDASGRELTGSTPASPAAAPLVATASVPEPGATASLLTALGIVSASLLRRRRD